MDDNTCNKKNENLSTTTHKPVEEENPYVQFVYGPKKDWNHTPGQVSGSMNNNIVNIKYTGKKTTKKVFEMNLKDISDK